MRSFFLVLAVLGVAGCNHKWDNVKVKPLEEGKKEVALKDLHGKVLLLDFWATWCGPCRKLAPDINELYEEYSKDGLMVLAISDEDPNVVKSFTANTHHSYPYFTDETQNAYRAFNVTGVPTLILIGKNGDIIDRSSGYPMQADFVESIKNALK